MVRFPFLATHSLPSATLWRCALSSCILAPPRRDPAPPAPFQPRWATTCRCPRLVPFQRCPHRRARVPPRPGETPRRRFPCHLASCSLQTLTPGAVSEVPRADAPASTLLSTRRFSAPASCRSLRRRLCQPPPSVLVRVPTHPTIPTFFANHLSHSTKWAPPPQCRDESMAPPMQIDLCCHAAGVIFFRRASSGTTRENDSGNNRCDLLGAPASQSFSGLPNVVQRKGLLVLLSTFFPCRT